MEKPNWFKKDREIQKLMSKAVENARNQVEALVANNFWYGEGINRRRKKEFTWWEFTPKDSEQQALLNESEVLEALGVNLNLETEKASSETDRGNGEVERNWPTIVPNLYYVRIGVLGSSKKYDYFRIIENLDEKGVQFSAEPPKEESLSEENRRLWSQPDADKKAQEELTKEFGEKP